MKKSVLLVFVFCFCCGVSFAQTPGEWTWMSGDPTNFNGVFGIQGVPNSLNHPPALYEAGSWTDLQGNFWLYGGEDYDDLWKYDVTTNMWTWVNGTGLTGQSPIYGVKGVAAATNHPGGRELGMFNWTDTMGNLWFLGGGSWNTTDLWKYDISSNMWTWVAGDSINGYGQYGVQGIPSPNNTPPLLTECASAWVDNYNNLWLFGGQVNFSAISNDLWKYDISTNEWTWMKGDKTAGATAVYGTKGISNPTNDPGERYSYSHWKDKSGNFWIFGGGNSGLWNDMWKYDLSTNQWTWMNGTNIPNDSGSYSAYCDSGSANLPFSRFENRACWTDSCGHFWMMGGGNPASYEMNDLWQFDPSTLKWRLISGSKAINSFNVYGTIGVSSPTNIPGGRTGANGWMDAHGNLWLFGGVVSARSELWRYVPNAACSGGCIQSLLTANFTTNTSNICAEGSNCINFSDISVGNPTSWQWQFPGATPDTSSQQNPTNICYYNIGTYPVTLIVANASGSDTLTVSPMITVGGTPPAPTITVVGDTLYSSHASGYQWYLNGSAIASATDSFYVWHQGGTYAVQITDSTSCSVLSNGVLASVDELSYDAGVTVYPNPASKTLIIGLTPASASGGRGGAGATIEIYDVLGEKVASPPAPLQKRGESVVIDVSALSDGVYFLRIDLGDSAVNKKFVVLH